MSTKLFAKALLVLTITAGGIACAPMEDDDFEDIGAVADAKDDALAIKDRALTLPAGKPAAPSVRRRRVHTTSSFRAELHYAATATTRIRIRPVGDAAKERASDQTSNPTLSFHVEPGAGDTYDIYFENFAASAVSTKYSVLGETGDDLSALRAAAMENLHRISKEIDLSQVRTYGLSGTPEEQFMGALEVEYARNPDQLKARLKALSSMVFFSLPEVTTPAIGTITPFHGLDEAGFEGLMSIEDQVFSQLVYNNGGVQGVRPFSVCETRFMIEKFVRPTRAYPGFGSYKAEYATFAASCPQKDKDEWYNFRGLGGLRPSWLESNIQDRFLRRMAKQCQAPTGTWIAECARWNADRLAYRQAGNKQLASRFMFYTAADEQYLADPNNLLLLLEDRTGDGIGEFLRPGAVTLKSGEQGTLDIRSNGTFSGGLKFTPTGGVERNIAAEDVEAESAIDPRFGKEMLALPDLGLSKVFSDPTGCTGTSPSPESCPLLKRFYVTIDRHENFYQTYTAMTPSSSSLGSQPSPLVACSITLRASHQWDTAGTPQGGTAGFIFLMRIPFKQILAGIEKSVSTLSPGPEVTPIQHLYTGHAELDLGKLWLDIATLSNNQYENEHEISKFGAVPAEQIEGILVVRRPAAVP